MKKTYSSVSKEIRDAGRMINLAGNQKAKETWSAKLASLHECMACGCLGKVCPPGCESL